MITNEQLLAALNAVPPLEWEAVGKNGIIKTTLPTGHVIELSKEGHSSYWLLFVTDPTESVVNTTLPPAHAHSVLASTTTFDMASTSFPSTHVVWQLEDDATNEV